MQVTFPPSQVVARSTADVMSRALSCPEVTKVWSHELATALSGSRRTTQTLRTGREGAASFLDN